MELPRNNLTPNLFSGFLFCLLMSLTPCWLIVHMGVLFHVFAIDLEMFQRRLSINPCVAPEILIQ